MKRTVPLDHQAKTIPQGEKILSQYGHLALAPVFMGAGKTLMSLYMAIGLQYQQIIIICPKTLMANWKSEIEKHTDFKNIFEWSNQRAKTDKYKNEFKRYILRNQKIFLLNIEAFQIPNKNLFKIIEAFKNRNEKTFVILDESTKIKSADAARTKRVIESFPIAWHRSILTGTPITNSPLDFFCQYEFLKPGFWGMTGQLKKCFYRFRARYAVLVDERVSRDRVIKKVIGFRKLDELKKKIEYCTIQLRKEDCVNLPEKIEQEIPIEMSDEHRTFYDTFVKRLIAELDGAELSVQKAIAKFTRLRQICGGFFPSNDCGIIKRVPQNMKLNFLMDDIEDTDEKIIIVANYHEEINLIYDVLTAEYDKDSTACYTGVQGIETRQANLEAFRDNDATRFLLINPMTGAFGLNLQFARIMYFYSLPTSPEQYQQLKDRIHRIGQKNNCLYKYLMYTGSIDNRIKYLLDKKEELSKLFTSKEAIKEFLLEGIK